MADDSKPRRVEIKDEDQTIAAAEVTPLADSAGTVRTTVAASSGPAPPGSRASLIDAVMDLPEVQDSSRLEATIPLGDTESLERLRERTDETVTRPAGSTALVDGNIPPASHPASSQEPGSAPRRGPGQAHGDLREPEGDRPQDRGLSGQPGRRRRRSALGPRRFSLSSAPG